MTDFLSLNDITVASTGGGFWHHVGFDVRINDWPDIKTELRSLDPTGTLTFREAKKARDGPLGDGWMWVWVVMKHQTPITVIMHLATLGRPTHSQIKFRGDEFP